MLLIRRPLRFLVTRVARAYGFFDPISLLGKLRGFSQPSEFAEPIELLRAGMLFHARGLVNTKAIQNNLDWIWPFWVERQFNPADDSFIPRAFSFSHINLTHRNWTAVGLPDVPYYPIVDPRGLVTPLFDGWSLDFWIVPSHDPQAAFYPSKVKDEQVIQTLDFTDTLRVHSQAVQGQTSIVSDVTLTLEAGEPVCRIAVKPSAPYEGHLVVALRPYNPEGISFIEKLEIRENGLGWNIQGREAVTFDRVPERDVLSVYRDGDVSLRLKEPTTTRSVSCPVGMATGAALFPLTALRDQPLIVRAPVCNELAPKKKLHFTAIAPWQDALAPLAKLRIPDARLQTLYELAAANLVLHSPGEVYPGPYTYKRFWFRDAAFVLHALLLLGGVDRTRRALAEFAPRQRNDGYFLSQQGEWDANGEALWTFQRFVAVTGETLPQAWLDAVAKGAKWITRKRLPLTPPRPEAGLLPAGFSAEHLGPNDFYYWDDFWGVAGLQSAARLLAANNPELSRACEREAAEFLATIERSFPAGPHRRFPGAIPASPKRRMDSGAVGSLVADYPLQLFPPGDPRILKTADYLRDHSTYRGGFFQNMIHSGINAYLTLHLAQVRLRAGQVDEAWALIDAVAALASPTGQWPEAIHPRTLGGCMGDGEHIWAAAEWALMLRNCFVREEHDRLIIGAGLRPEWIRSGEEISFGPTLTSFGPISVKVKGLLDGTASTRIDVDATWRGTPPPLDLHLPAHRFITIDSPASFSSFALSPTP